MVEVALVYHNQDDKLFRYQLRVEEGSTIASVLALANFYQQCPEAKGLAFGVFGKKRPATYQVKDGDRIEVYRPLRCDPKEKRRTKAIRR